MRLLCLLLVVNVYCFAFSPSKPMCIAPAKPGGGFDLTCRLVSNSLSASKLLNKNMLVNFMPGGIGAVAFNHVISKTSKDPNSIVAASVGSALNIAQNKFGNHSYDSVRWVGTLATDYGTLIVRQDAKWNTLKEMLDELKADPKAFAIGGGGSIGSQDWFKVALIVEAAGINPRDIKYVAFEGGGEAFSALLGGHVQVVSGDASEFAAVESSKKYRALAIMADKPLSGKLSYVPTAISEGYNVVWNTWRGFYIGKDIKDEEYLFWVNLFSKLVQTKEFKEERESKGLYELNVFGDDFRDLIASDIARFKDMAIKQGLLQ